MSTLRRKGGGKKSISEKEIEWMFNSDESSSSDDLGGYEDTSESEFSEESCSSAESDDHATTVTDESQNEISPNTNVGNDTTTLDGWGQTVGAQLVTPFTGKEAINLGRDRSSLTPLDAYQLMVTDDIIDYMVEQTNINANNYIATHQLKRSSRVKTWMDISRKEMKEFLGIRIWMGLVKMPQITDYWSEAIIYQNGVAKKAMSRNRLQIILKFWHFGPNDPILGRLHKIQPLLDMLEIRYKEVKTPGRFLVIDESMVPFRGRLIFRQYMPFKAARYGVKEFKLCDPTGYTFKVIVYAGKGTCTAGTDLSMATQIVMNLMDPYLDQGRVVCTDNYYTSIELLNKLLERKTHFVGTVRKNRKGLPKEVTTAKLQKGGIHAMENRNNGATVMKWKGQRDVLMISTTFPATMTQTGKRNRRGEMVTKPKMVIEYNKIKGGIDIADTLSSYHCTLRKTIRWYHKVADDALFGTCIVNAFLLWNETRIPGARLMSLQQFRREIVEKWLHIPKDSIDRTSKKSTHYLENTENTEGKLLRKARGRCRGCYKELIRTMSRKVALSKAKRVSTRCMTCPDQPYLCLPCFKSLHESSPDTTPISGFSM